MPKVPKPLKVIAGMAGVASVYWAGRQSGMNAAGDTVFADGVEPQGAGQAAQVSSASEPVADNAREAAPVAAAQSVAADARAVRPVASPRDASAYHAAISARAARLRAQIVQQALATEAPQELLEVESPEVLDGKDVAPSAPAAQDAQVAQDKQPAPEPEDAAPADATASDDTVSEPYQMIKDALETTELFTEDSEKAYKPTPFAMPEK